MPRPKPPHKAEAAPDLEKHPMPQGNEVGPPPTNLDFEKSLMFFHAYMYGPLQGKLRLYSARGVHARGGVLSSDWEVFASMLVGDVGEKLHSGIDLVGHEVKAAGLRASYEYQYHKESGREKLAKDMRVGHLFFEYSDNLKNVTLRYAHGSQMKEQFFDKWLEEFPVPYRQRYRKSIPYGWVKKNGALLMTLTSGEVSYPTVVAAEPLPKSIED